MALVCSLKLDASYSVGAFRHLKGEHNRVSENAQRVTLQIEDFSEQK